MEIIEEEDINSDEDDSSKFEKPEPPEEDKFYNNRSNLYAFSVLSILTLLRISFLWQRKSFKRPAQRWMQSFNDLRITNKR